MCLAGAAQRCETPLGPTTAALVVTSRSSPGLPTQHSKDVGVSRCDLLVSKLTWRSHLDRFGVLGGRYACGRVPLGPVQASEQTAEV